MKINDFIIELKKLNIEITDYQLSQLEKYYELVIEWNKKINLTGITNKEEFYLKHFYDSLTIIKIIDLNKYNNLCDIGTGAGFPGLVLKILYPDLNITLLDSLNKRIEFLNLVINKLNLDKIETIHSRAEEYSKLNREKFDIVVARAVAHINVLLEYSIPMVKIDKYFIAMKANAEQEIIDVKSALKKLDSKIEKVEEFKLPYEESKRTLIRIKKEKQTSKKFPRKYSEIKKNCL